VSIESKIRDGLRLQGLVPPAEDVPLIACSTDYRTKLRAAVGGLADPKELEERIEFLEEQLELSTGELTVLQSELDDARADNEALRKESEHASRLATQMKRERDLALEQVGL
jgi:hypothetical protein